MKSCYQNVATLHSQSLKAILSLYSPDLLQMLRLSNLAMNSRKKRIRLSRKPVPDPFDSLPDDLVICVLSKLCSSSSSPSEFINALIVCKRFNELGLNPMVLSKASSQVFSIRAKNWSDSSHRFVGQCVHAGSIEASYFLGMIWFYCLGNRKSGASLMAKAAIRHHAPSLFSLAIIHFNGSSATKTEKDPRAGVALCARAKYLGHVDAWKELGYCLQDGYGVRRNATEGRRLLIQASVIESGLLSVFGSPQPHPANRFLVEWFGLFDSDEGVCSNSGCGRPETRPNEFRRCSVCESAKYCSRSCQASDWKLRHKTLCTPAPLHWGEGGG